MCQNASVNLEIDDQEDTVHTWLSQTNTLRTRSSVTE